MMSLPCGVGEDLGMRRRLFLALAKFWRPPDTLFNVQYAKLVIVFTNSPTQPVMMKSSSQKLETRSALVSSRPHHDLCYLKFAVRPPKTGGSGSAR
jgi:hypothetical protein